MKQLTLWLLHFSLLYQTQAMPISHKWVLERLRQWNCDLVLMRGWPRHPNTNHLMQWTTRSMLLGGVRWAAWRTHVVMAKTVGCY